MNRTGEFLAQDIVHKSLTGDPRKPFKRAGNHKQPEVRFAPFPRAGMAGVEMRFIDNLEALRLKRSG